MISFGYLSPLFLLVNINFLFQFVIEPQGAGLQLDFPFGNTQLVFSFPVYVLFCLLVAPPASIPYPVQMTGQ